MNAARIAGHVRPEARARIEACHRTVVEAESALFESRRKDRPSALTRYQQALAAERTVLAQAGVDSYAAFLVAIAQGTRAVDLEARLRAELELADAEAAARQARARLQAPDGPSIAERAVELRARAAQLLGRFPADDPAADLRALRVEHPDRAVPMKELRELLAELGEVPTGDVVAFARDLESTRASTPPKQPPPRPRRPPLPRPKSWPRPRPSSPRNSVRSRRRSRR